jgi:hypothetical protein
MDRRRKSGGRGNVSGARQTSGTYTGNGKQQKKPNNYQTTTQITIWAQLDNITG